MPSRSSTVGALEQREADISVGNAAANKYDGDHLPEQKRKYADGRHGANDGTIY